MKRAVREPDCVLLGFKVGGEHCAGCCSDSDSHCADCGESTKDDSGHLVRDKIWAEAGMSSYWLPVQAVLGEAAWLRFTVVA